MSDEWLTVRQTSECLSCPLQTVRGMLHSGLLPGEKVNGRWRVEAAKVEQLRAIMTLAPATTAPSSMAHHGAEPGMVEVTMALAGIAAAIAAFLPSAIGPPDSVGLIGVVLAVAIAILAGIVAAFSAYSALWLLAWCRLEGESPAGINEIMMLLLRPGEFRPYCLMAWGMLAWLILSVLIGALAIMAIIR